MRATDVNGKGNGFVSQSHGVANIYKTPRIPNDFGKEMVNNDEQRILGYEAYG